MMNLKFDLKKKKNRGLKILCLGAHCDDIEIGCGGTILKLIQQYEIEEIQWVVFCSNDLREKEAEESAEQFLANVKNKQVTVFNFKDGYTPMEWGKIKDTFEDLKKRINPDIIFTHTRKDRHQDHRTIHNFTWNTFRNHIILEYEIPKYDGDLGKPNLFVSLNREIVNKKTEIIRNAFKSQVEKQWFDEKLFLGLMRIRGVECVSVTGFAEAYTMRKGVL